MEQHNPAVYQQFLGFAAQLEKTYRDMQDLEFTVERGKLYMLQTRSGKRTGRAAVKIAKDMEGEGLISKDEALLRVEPSHVVQLLLPRFDAVVVPISPYARVFEAVRSREVDAALLIHEGRLTYEREGFARVCDIGEAWGAGTAGLPLPLGGNAIRRSLGADTVAQVSRLCRASIAWALEHRDETMAALEYEIPIVTLVGLVATLTLGRTESALGGLTLT